MRSFTQFREDEVRALSWIGSHANDFSKNPATGLTA